MPTALELTRKEWRRYIESARHRTPLPEPTPSELKERERLLGRVRKAADVLKTRFGARSVILFGSLAHKAWFTSKSDVDLAVEGLDADDYWEAWRVIEELITDPIEDSIANVEDIKAMDSYSIENVSIVFIEFETDADIAERVRELQDEVNKIEGQLPDGVTAPVVTELNYSNAPILVLTMSADLR